MILPTGIFPRMSQKVGGVPPAHRSSDRDFFLLIEFTLTLWVLSLLMKIARIPLHTPHTHTTNYLNLLPFLFLSLPPIFSFYLPIVSCYLSVISCYLPNPFVLFLFLAKQMQLYLQNFLIEI
uniref:Uncharacterized protein n=1 Tax=Cacopsylla melanoneura TaxID=428564 RepID=A0A8D8TB13_9HEMI